jgi:hypothetical protein
LPANGLKGKYILNLNIWEIRSLSFRKRTKFPVFEQYLRKIREDFKDNDIDIDSDQVNWIPKIDGKILLQMS